MDPVEALVALGGVALWSQLAPTVSWRALQAAVDDGRIIKVYRGTYAVPGLIPGHAAALRLRGVVSHSSAAIYWGLEVLGTATHVTVSRKARPGDVPIGVNVHYATVTPAERAAGVTDMVRTVLDCADDLGVCEALTIGDSVLRKGLLGREELAAAAGERRGPGSARVRRVVGWMDGGAANALESSLRALLLDAGLDGFEAQLRIRHDGRFLAQVDLGDPRRRLAIEAESFRWHGQRHQLVRDCRRYTELVAAGWRVLRFTWEDVMTRPTDVVAAVRAACR